MKDDDIIKEAEKIKARRDRAEIARRMMRSKRVVMMDQEPNGSGTHIDVPVGPHLAAFLCHILDCDITEGLTAQQSDSTS